jgi:Carboxypeptidase regulatory-like domain
MRPLGLVFTLLLFSALAGFPQASNSPGPEGVISGTVVDEQGQPVKGAQIVITQWRTSADGSTQGQGKDSGTTDEAGRFRVDHVPMGKISVEASKHEEGYAPHLTGTGGIETVTLTPDQPVAEVVLRVGPKAGMLLPTVKDKHTGNPINDFLVHWVVFDPDEPNRGSSGSAGVSRWTRSVTLPPEKDLIVTISKRGYKNWLYSDPSDLSRPAFLRLQSGEQRELAVELEPQPKDAATAQ